MAEPTPSAQAGALEELALLLRPLGALASPQGVVAFLSQLGWEVPAAVSVSGSAGDFTAKLSALRTSLLALQAATDDQDRYSKAAAVLADASALLTLLPDLGQQITDAVTGSQQFAANSGIEHDLFRRLVDFLLISRLREVSPAAYDAGLLLGIFSKQEQKREANRFRREARIDRVEWERLPKLFSDPMKVVDEVYGWSTTFDAELFLSRLFGLLMRIGLPADVRLQPDAVADRLQRPVDERHEYRVALLQTDPGTAFGEAGLRFSPVPGDGGQLGAGIAVSPYIEGAVALKAEIAAGLEVAVSLSLGVAGVVVFVLRPPRRVSVAANLDTGGNTSVTGEVKATLTKRPTSGTEILLVGSPAASRLTVRELMIGLTASTRGTTEREFTFAFSVTELAVAIIPGDGDGFLQKVLPPDGLRASADVGIAVSSRTGLHITGGGGLEVTLPVNKNLGGVVQLDSVFLAVLAKPDGLTTVIALTGGLRIGPVAVSVQHVGVAARYTVPASGAGNLGPVDVSFAFKAPDGLGLVIDAGPVTGGGFISFEEDTGRYSGVLELSIAAIAVKVIGLLDTRLPGGRPGFSFLLIVSAEFSPIQLGFGFTLNGVGGLAGINRGLAVEPLRAGIRAHSVDRILFPEDPVRDAAQIISDLRTIFPPTEGRYVFGPMAIIGYGTPTIVEAEIGIILELPSPFRLVLLGQVNAALPQAEEAIVELHLDVLGVLDFGAQTLSIDASLHDSRIAAFNVYGDMAFRRSWGAEPNFGLSVGGFHPAFRAPPDFPELRRLTVALGDGENPRLTLQAYLAVTSNTFQVGARAELYAEAAGFNVIGWVGFDALFVFSPFSFQTEFSAGFALRRGTKVIAGIHLEASLTGPSPFHARGEASITILFFEITISVEATFGEERRVAAPVGDPWSALRDEIADLRNWTATLPPAAFRVVSLAATATDPDLRLVDPLGGLTLRQKVVPLGRTLTKFGESVLPVPQRFAVRHDQVRVGGRSVGSSVPVEDQFAPAQFETLSDEARLSRPSFERMEGGLSLASDALAFTVGGGVRGLDATYETKTIDVKGQPPTVVPGTYTMTSAQQASQTGRAAAARAGPHATGLERFSPRRGKPSGVRLAVQEYLVLDAVDLSMRADVLAEPTTKGAAHRALETWTAAHPEDRGRVIVAPTQDVAT